MKRINRYGVRSLEKDFPNDDVCLEFLFDAQHSKACSCGGTYKRVKGRKQYQCSKCRFQIAPLAGTIFHKSDTPLTLWFKAILAFSNAKSGVSAKYMERELEVTYKTAWRMLMLIRKALKQSTDKLSGDVELDTAYIGGRKSGGTYNKYQKQAIAAKSVVMGAVERDGNIRIQVVPNATGKTHASFLAQAVAKEGTRLMTDSAKQMTNATLGYDRYMVNHNKGEYARGDVYTNTIDGFWAHVKRSMKGTHKVVSKKYLQNYLDGFVFHYDNRHNDKTRFSALLGTVLLGAR